MIQLTITPAAYAVIVATHPRAPDSERNSAPNGKFYVWLEPKYVDRLRECGSPARATATLS